MMASIKKTYSRHMISTRKNTVGRSKNTDYYERYLKQAKKAGLDVYIVEYRAGKELSKKSTHIASDTGINGTMPTELN